MYHMIAIPPLFQHVHRFIWRVYETEQEPDVYVKTVLTFGDRPAPTMAITAMRKTAEMRKESNAKAAETMIKNTYVDDICNSVQNVDESRAMTSSIDKVLETGGFHVKKWGGFQMQTLLTIVVQKRSYLAAKQKRNEF